MRQDGKIDYVEFPATELGPLQAFYGEAFGWTFTEYGPSYVAFAEGVDGGFQADADDAPRAQALVILYASDLEAAQDKVRAAGGTVTQPIFAFPGGRRFHFRDPSGNELGVWSDH